MSRGCRRFLMPGLAAVAVTIGSIAYAADVLTQFRLTEEDAHQGVFDSLWRGTPDSGGPAPSIFRGLAPQARATAVTAAAAFVRAFCESDTFRTSYAAKRQAERPPDMPETTGAKVDVDKSTAKMDASMAEARAAMAPVVRGDVILDLSLPDAGTRLRDSLGDGRIEAWAGDRTRWRTHADTVPWLASQILHLGCEFEVCGPPELSSYLCDIADRIVRAVSK